MGESTQTGFSRPLMQNQDKTMTQAFHLEADNIPVTFPGKCQGWDKFKFGWQATRHRKRNGGVGGGGGPAFPSYAKECHCEQWKSSDKKYLQISCFYLHGVPDGWSLPQPLSSPPDAVGRFNQMLSKYLQKPQDVDMEASLNALFVRNTRLVLTP